MKEGIAIGALATAVSTTAIGAFTAMGHATAWLAMLCIGATASLVSLSLIAAILFIALRDDGTVTESLARSASKQPQQRQASTPTKGKRG